MPSWTFKNWDALKSGWPVIKMTCKALFDNEYTVVITLGNETRTQEQNRLMWPLLQDLSNQALLNNERLTPAEWKCVCMSSFLIVYKNVTPKMRQGLENEIVMLNYSTRNLGKRDFSALIEVIYAAGCQKGVKFTDKSTAIYDEYKEAQ